MGEMKDIKITIGGRTLVLSGESEEYMQKVASYLNGKRKSFHDDSNYWKLTEDMKNIMLQLNLADDYFKEQDKVAELEGRMDCIREEAREEVGEELRSLPDELREDQGIFSGPAGSRQRQGGTGT